MNWEQKLHAMQYLGLGNALRMSAPGEWICSVPGEIGGDGLLRSECGRGSTPELAVNAAWSIIEHLPADRHLRIGSRCIRWNGFMFEEVPDAQ